MTRLHHPAVYFYTNVLHVNMTVCNRADLDSERLIHFVSYSFTSHLACSNTIPTTTGVCVCACVW